MYIWRINPIIEYRESTEVQETQILLSKRGAEIPWTFHSNQHAMTGIIDIVSNIGPSSMACIC